MVDNRHANAVSCVWKIKVPEADNLKHSRHNAIGQCCSGRFIVINAKCKDNEKEFNFIIIELTDRGGREIAREQEDTN